MNTLTRRVLASLLWAAGGLFAQQPQETEVRSLIADFLKAFNNLDWAAFRKCWVDNPVVFFPSAAANPTGKRIDDLPSFDATWRRQFDLIRENAQRRGVTGPPFQNLAPKDLRIDFPAPTVAVVTFHLGPSQNNSLGRRMFVVAKTPDGWKITHLHASNLSLEPQ
jgi:ketosteroid isomerase-like protein